MGTKSHQSPVRGNNSNNINVSSATTTPTHHRTRSRMDEVLQAHSNHQTNSNNNHTASPQRGKKRKVFSPLRETDL